MGHFRISERESSKKRIQYDDDDDDDDDDDVSWLVLPGDCQRPGDWRSPAGSSLRAGLPDNPLQPGGGGGERGGGAGGEAPRRPPGGCWTEGLDRLGPVVALRGGWAGLGEPGRDVRLGVAPREGDAQHGRHCGWVLSMAGYSSER